MVDPLVRKILLDRQSEDFLEIPLYKSSHSMGEIGMLFDVNGKYDVYFQFCAES